MLVTGPINGLCKKMQPFLGNFFKKLRSYYLTTCDLKCKVLHTTLGA
jgi:hypothetical protein